VSADHDQFDASSETSETLYLQLRRIAQARFARLPVSHAVQATDLLHEVWAKLAERPWNDREHFVSTFARSAQQILVDVARQRARRRDRHRQYAEMRLDDAASAAAWRDPVGHPEEFLLLDEAITALRLESPTAADQLLTHLLLDVSVETIANSCEPPVSTRTVQRNLKTARLWVHRWMSRRLERDAAGSDELGDGPAASDPLGERLV
jgi:RNA polymerase sigma factor (TIGR02999 family)